MFRPMLFKSFINQFVKLVISRSIMMLRGRNRVLRYIEVHLAEHCNLNCAYCSHYCPVAEPEFPNIEQFERDFIKLSELTGGYITTVRLLGGEPLLNPDVTKFMPIVRRNIPKGTIELVTNGILLTKMNDDFWIACKNNKITIKISQYPIKLDICKIFKIAQKHKVHISFPIRSNRNFVFRYQKIDITGKRDIRKAFANCTTKVCTALKDGNIYMCSQIPCTKHLEKRFGVNFSISENDFLVLDKINNLREILNFISRPSSFCRYCASEEKTFVSWKISEKKKEEWF